MQIIDYRQLGLNATVLYSLRKMAQCCQVCNMYHMNVILPPKHHFVQSEQGESLSPAALL